jgi:DNA-binding transcriptional LysR family regulator
LLRRNSNGHSYKAGIPIYAHSAETTMSSGLNFSRLELFCQVAGFGSLTKAAVMLDTAPSAISRQLTILESECGGRLFHRTGRGVSLTDLGERILPRAQSLLAEADQFAKEIKGTAHVASGEVRIGVLAATAESLVPSLFRRVQKQYPEVLLRVLEGTTGQLDEWVSVGRIDIALVVRQGKSVAPNEYPLALSRSYLIGAPDQPLVDGDTIDFARLHGVPLILPGLPNGLRASLSQLAKQQNIDLNVALEADSMSIQTSMVEQGCGFTILPKHAVLRELREGTLKAAKIVNPEIQRTITLTTTRQKPLNLACREVFRLVRCIVEELSNEQTGIWQALERPGADLEPADGLPEDFLEVESKHE